MKLNGRSWNNVNKPLLKSTYLGESCSLVVNCTPFVIIISNSSRLDRIDGKGNCKEWKMLLIKYVDIP